MRNSWGLVEIGLRNSGSLSRNGQHLGEFVKIWSRLGRNCEDLVDIRSSLPRFGRDLIEIWKWSRHGRDRERWPRNHQDLVHLSRVMSGYAIASEIEAFMGSARTKVWGSQRNYSAVLEYLRILSNFELLPYFRAMKGDYLAPTIPIFQHLQRGSNEPFSEFRYIP